MTSAYIIITGFVIFGAAWEDHLVQDCAAGTRAKRNGFLRGFHVYALRSLVLRRNSVEQKIKNSCTCGYLKIPEKTSL